MSDTVLLAIVGGVVGLATLYLKSRIDAKALIAAAVALEKASLAKIAAEEKALLLENKVDTVKEKMDVVEKKLDENHKQANGHMTTLLETTKKLGEEIGKQKEKDNPTK